MHVAVPGSHGDEKKIIPAPKASENNPVIGVNGHDFPFNTYSISYH